ncbi:acyl-CoA dehydrogenase family protein [Alcaligenaceae bacterium]|nr:acyl-CoA dehydrogenase family protein [Alcaligenaceae bacterium]
MDIETFEQVREAVRRFTRERLVPLERQIEEEGRIPQEVIDEMGQLGLFGLNISERYGGLGLTVREEVEVVTELTWAAAAFRSIISMNIGAGVQGLIIDGTPDQKQQWLPRIASGEIIAAFALTEPDSGSDSAALTTKAVRDGDTYIINGTKRWVTNAPLAGLITVMARTNPDKQAGHEGISAFLVPTDTPGITIGAKEHKMGQFGSELADVFFDDVRVEAANLLGGTEGRGFKTAMKAVTRNRLNIAAVCVGQARRILHEALAFAVERKQFGKRIAEFQLIQAMLADSETDLYAAEAMLKDAAQAYDDGQEVARKASCCKLFASEMVGRLADRAVQVHGGAGYMRDSAVERLYRDVRAFRIYGGTTQIQQLIIARDMLREATA